MLLKRTLSVDHSEGDEYGKRLFKGEQWLQRAAHRSRFKVDVRQLYSNATRPLTKVRGGGGGEEATKVQKETDGYGDMNMQHRAND